MTCSMAGVMMIRQSIQAAKTITSSIGTAMVSTQSRTSGPTQPMAKTPSETLSAFASATKK